MATVMMSSLYRDGSVQLKHVKDQYHAFLKKWKDDIEECGGPEHLFAGSTARKLFLLGTDVGFNSKTRFSPPAAGIFRFFSSDSGIGTGCEVGLGVPFPPDFYRELYDIFSHDNGTCACEWEMLMSVSSDGTSFGGTVILTAKGLEWDFERDTWRDKKDEQWNDVDEYSETPKPRKKPIWLHVVGRLQDNHLARAILAGGELAEFFWNRGWYFYRDLYIGLDKPDYSQLHIEEPSFVLHCEYSPRRLPKSSAKDFRCYVLARAADERVYKLSDEDLNRIIAWYNDSYSADDQRTDEPLADIEGNYIIALHSWIYDLGGGWYKEYEQIGVDGDWVDIERLPMAE